MRLPAHIITDLPGYPALAAEARAQHPTASESQVLALVDDAITQGWRTGNLFFLVRPYQLPLYDWIGTRLSVPGDEDPTALLGARRFGKTHVIMIRFIELGLRRKLIMRVYTSTKTQLWGILHPIINDILATCPPELTPNHHRLLSGFRFHSGALMTLHGTEKPRDVDNMRGWECHAAFVDEAGYLIPERYTTLTGAVLSPVLKHSRGPLITSSTPPPGTSHPWITNTLKIAEQTGGLLVQTVDDMNLDPETVARWETEVTAAHGKANWQREYKCRILSFSERRAVPAWTPAAARQLIYGRHHSGDVSLDALEHRPPHFGQCAYFVCMDFGFVDGHGVSFGYFDPIRMEIVIERELATRGGCTTAELSRRVQDIERALYIDPCTASPLRRLFRVGDNANAQAIADLNRGFGDEAPPLLVTPCQKTSLRGMFDHLNNAIRRRAFKAHASCTDLTASLTTAQYTVSSAHAKSARITKDAHGHHDVLMSAVYACFYLRDPKAFGLPDWSTRPMPMADLAPLDGEKARRGARALGAAFSRRKRRQRITL